MTPLSKAPEVIFSFAKKLATYENGALALMSALPSYTIMEILNIIFDGIPLKSIFMPFLIGAVALSVYGLVFTIDFITGVRASRYEAKAEKGWFKSDKGWSSMWKLVSIYLLIAIQIPFALAFLAIGLDFIKDFFLIVIMAIGIAASLLDMISIGENHERRYNKKPAIFDLIERISNAFNEGIIKYITKPFR